MDRHCSTLGTYTWPRVRVTKRPGPGPVENGRPSCKRTAEWAATRLIEGLPFQLIQRQLSLIVCEAEITAERVQHEIAAMPLDQPFKAPGRKKQD